MSKEKQIEEMSVIMREAYLKECIHPDCHNCEMYNHDDRHNGLCKEKYRAEALYNAGYRKQSEGENMAIYPTSSFECSLCNWSNWDLATGDGAYNYCPNCGAKMKGGA